MSSVSWVVSLLCRKLLEMKENMNFSSLTSFFGSIWNHLVEISKDGNKTVIITTHYIEEARQAHCVSSLVSSFFVFFFHPVKIFPMTIFYFFSDRLDEKRKTSGRRIAIGASNDLQLPKS